MTNRKQKTVINDKQMSLFDLLTQQRCERIEHAPGTMCVSVKLLAAVKQAIKQAPKSRETIADELSLLTGAEISIHMINSWVADSHPHRLPAEFLPALCHATGSTAPIRVLADAAGIYALQAPDALRAEIQQYDEAESAARAQKRKRKALLAVIEGGEL
ncbi:MAG: hypothetical protein B6I36_02410 [Desulfobacteraceae bacterium 4572_35.1]|nr:MAG: hypothetical protein B6I36_02410 [Desulfobacteraceae bacterium 4572_35.1]